MTANGARGRNRNESVAIEPVAVGWFSVGLTSGNRSPGSRRSWSSVLPGVYNRSSEVRVGTAPVELDRDLVDLLEELRRPAKKAARELIVLELYRQGDVSSGRAAQLLNMEREEFIRYASKQGIPYFQVEGDELQRELDAIKKL
jgi:predicted HTH domain antitoxin